MFTAANEFYVSVGEGVEFADYDRRDVMGFETGMFCVSWPSARVELIYRHDVG
jgi:hypothetical protein